MHVTAGTGPRASETLLSNSLTYSSLISALSPQAARCLDLQVGNSADAFITEHHQSLAKTRVMHQHHLFAMPRLVLHRTRRRSSSFIGPYQAAATILAADGPGNK